ncbi:hypothetical protein PanWU01x14_239040 [Parasponia andersonii]|uniref:Uncharacterized protein n=1 Tax=Parasponia andersonii TaxID=3476 RepID=A0A2P5BHJ2_PARAD|nr:hypothetical protein PanWU01x14_239040 [Parasponia andersonii]
MVEPPLLEIMKYGGRRLVDEEQDEADLAMESLKLAFEVMPNAADLLRTIVKLKVTEVLKPTSKWHC